MKGKVRLKCQWKYFDARGGNKDDRKKYIGKYYFDKKILDVWFLGAKNYIWHGLALLLDDGYWAFGCPPEYIFSSPKPRENK